MTTRIHVYDKDTRAPIEGATVTCTGYTPQLTDGNGNVSFELGPFTRYGLRADADGYVISEQQSIIGADNYVEFGLEKEEPIGITVKRPTWVSMIIMPSEAEYPIGEEIEVSGYIRIGTEPYTEGEVWLMDSDAGEIITEKFSMDDFGAGSYYELRWTPSEYKTGGYNITVGCDAFISGSNPLGAWGQMPNGSSKYLNVVGVGMANMGIYPHTLSGNLFESNEDTIVACDDPEKACTMFKFQIRNNSNVTTGAWYKVSIVGGGTLYTGTTPALGRWEYSEKIEDYICALSGGLPVGTHTVKVEVGSEGYATPTDTLTDEIHVLSSAALSVTTHAATDISQNSARISGSITDTNDNETDIGFEYGETTSYGTTVWTDMTTTPCDFFDDIADLEPHTLYYFRAIAENDTESAHGEPMSFWTREEMGGIYFSITLPSGSLLDLNEVMACDDHNLACTTFNFQIENEKGTTVNAWYKVSIAGGGTLYSETVTIPSYRTTETISDYVCALPGGLPVGEHAVLVEVGKEGLGTDVTEFEWLTVLEHGTPTVDTIRAENQTFNSATLVGELKDIGMDTRVGFEYGLLYGSRNTEWREGLIRSGGFKAAVRGLEDNEVYMFRAIAEAGGKTGYGEERSFLAAPAVIDVISLGWNLEDAKLDEYNAHLQITNLSEDRRYWLSLASARGHEYVRVSDVTGTKEAEIKINIAQDLLEEYGYTLTCRVYDSDIVNSILTQSYIVPPIDLELHTNISGPITVIPTTIRTETSYPFTIQVDNTGEKDREAGVVFVFKGIDLGPRYVFSYPLGEVSGIDTIIIPAGESVGYEIIISLPNEAVPTGATSVMYNLDILLPVFEYS